MPGESSRSGLTRRQAVLAGLTTAGLGAGSAQWWKSRHVVVPLDALTVALRAPGERMAVPPGQRDLIVPGTRVIAGRPQTARLVTQEQQWLGACAAWFHQQDEFSDLARSAALDLRILTVGLPACVAGWTQLWRYIWPRDTAAAAVALGLLGHRETAWQQLDFLARVHVPGQRFQARYSPMTGRAPDGRTPQLDGSGWALWALTTLWNQAPPPGTDRQQRLLGFARNVTEDLLHELGTPSGLPTASPDYWETREHDLTLATAATAVMGMRQAEILWRQRDPAVARRCRDAADRALQAIHRTFPDHARHPGGNDPDAGVTFLLPPYVPGPPERSALADLPRIEKLLARPGGGLAPGARWKHDGISWTPTTALFALAHAAGGERERAVDWLRWLSEHRTLAGSLPEKVLYDGTPAAVAPLAWTAALVLQAVHQVRTS